MSNHYIVLQVLKDEAGHLIQDVASGKGIKNSLKNSAKRIGKRVITKVLSGQGRKRSKTRRSIVKPKENREREVERKIYVSCS